LKKKYSSLTLNFFFAQSFGAALITKASDFDGQRNRGVEKKEREREREREEGLWLVGFAVPTISTVPSN